MHEIGGVPELDIYRLPYLPTYAGSRASKIIIIINVLTYYVYGISWKELTSFEQAIWTSLIAFGPLYC